jgi:hypothetical protein
MKPSKSGILVCQGATCTCTMAGGTTAKLKVITQQKYYINDDQGSDKLIATDMEKTVASLNFKTCKPGTFSSTPCAANLMWNNIYESMELSNGGKPLIALSKATCSTGGGMITILKHGQTTSLCQANFDNSNKDVHNQLNPLVNLGAVKYRDMDGDSGLTLTLDN